MSNRFSRRDVIRIGISGLGGLALGCSLQDTGIRAQENQPENPKRPMNLLFMNTDQQRFDALSCAGNAFVSTPNLDRLAREGVRFRSTVTPLPMCVPARASFHTGLSTCTTRCFATLNDKDMQFGSGSFDHNLAKTGYHTEYHGRWHAPTQLADCYENQVSLDFRAPYRKYLKETLGDPPKPEPGQYVSFLSGWPYTPDPLDAKYANLWAGKEDYQKVIGFGKYSLPPEHTYSAFVANQTIDALKRLRTTPFSISVGFLAPHHPWYIPEPFWGSIDPEKIPLPPTMDDDRKNTPYESFPWEAPGAYRKHMKLYHARYYELLQEVDYHIGRTLKALDDLDLAKNTLVIFTADHGEMLGDHGLIQKFVPYQGSIRVPMIMRLPGKIPEGRVADEPVNSIDIFATIFDYLGIPCPKQEGKSLRPLVEGNAGGWSEYTFSEWGWDTWIASTTLVSRDWKYVWTRSADMMDVLFDLGNDPDETTNLLGKNPDRAKYVPRAKEIRTEMLAWMETIKHPFREALAKSEIG